MIEALASGLPVITTKAAGGEFITHAQEGFLLDTYSDTDINSLSYYISVLIENDNLRKQLSQHARKTAERFNWDRITQEYLKLYKQIILSKR